MLQFVSNKVNGRAYNHNLQKPIQTINLSGKPLDSLSTTEISDYLCERPEGRYDGTVDSE